MIKEEERPLSQRTFVSKPSLSCTQPFFGINYPAKTPTRPDVYKRWSEHSISRAVAAVIDDGISVHQTVPRSTLGDRISGRVLPGAVSVRPRYLSIEEEEELVSFLLKSSSVGYPRTRKDVVTIVQTACSKRGMNVNVTHGWWQAFYHCHPYISLRITSSLFLARAKASDPAVISNYFDMLEDCMIKNDLLDKSAQIFNIDETGMPFNPASPRGICKRGVKTVPSISSGHKSQITVVGCVSAAGYCIPPMVIWDRKTLQPHIYDCWRGTQHGVWTFRQGVD